MLSYLIPSFHNNNDLRDLGSKGVNNSQLEVDLNISEAVVAISIDFVDRDFDHDIVFDPLLIRVHICNEDGRYISTLKKENVIASLSSKLEDSEDRIFYVPRGYTISSMKRHCCIQDTNDNLEDFSFVWKERILIDESYMHIMEESVVFLFEILDTKGLEKIEDPWSDDCFKHIAWGFLKPFGRDRKCNIGEKLDDAKQCRLQLFKYKLNSISVRRRAKQMDLLSNPDVPLVFLQYLRVKRIPIKSSLHIKVGPLLLLNNQNNDNHKEVIASPLQCTESTKQESLMKTKPNNDAKLFERGQDERCLIPDILMHRLDVTKPEIIKFSPSGDYLAVAANDSTVCTYDVESGKKISSCLLHSDKITALVWCDNDINLATASLDGTIVIFEFKENVDGSNEVDVCLFTLMSKNLPIHLEVVSIKYFEEVDVPSFGSFIVSANDKKLKLWNINEKRCVGDLYGGNAHHVVPITAVATDNSNYRIYSGDALGCIITWTLKRKLNQISICGSDYEVLHRIDGSRNLNGICIRGLDFSNVGGQKKLLIITDDRSNNRNLCIYDFACQLMIPFCSESKVNRNVFSTAIFSPDGMHVVSGTEDGKILYFDSSSGVSLESKISKTELKYKVRAVDWSQNRHMVAFCFENVPVLIFSVSPAGKLC